MHHHELVDQVHRLLMDNLPISSGKTPSGWTTFNCPMCSDKRKRGGVIQSNSKISYHCFNCNFTTGWFQVQTRAKIQSISRSIGCWCKRYTPKKLI